MFSKTQTLAIAAIAVTLVSVIGISISPIVVPRPPTSKITTLNSSQKERVAFEIMNEFVKLESNKINVSVGTDYEYSPIPTNRTWSSAVFSGDLTGYFTYPLAYRTEFESLLVGSPSVNSRTNAITTTLSSYIMVQGESGVHKTYLNSHSDLTAQFVAINELEEKQFSFTSIQGSPYTFITPLRNTMHLEARGFSFRLENGLIVAENDSNVFFLSTNGSGTISNNRLTISFNESEMASAFVNIGYSPKNDAAQNLIKDHLNNRIISVLANAKITNMEAVTEYSFQYQENDNTSTVFGLLPHHRYSLDDCSFTHDTIRGNQCFKKIDNTFSVSTPQVVMTEYLPIEVLTNSQKNELRKILISESNKTQQFAAASYFGGKDILRISQMLEIAYQLGENDSALRLQALLKRELEDWFSYTEGENGKHFVYDTYLGGLTAQLPEFGLEDYNDHHFQYSYYIYGSSVLSKYDQEFKDKYSPFINLLVRDIATSDRGDSLFPYFRVFDFFEGHSWASGFGRFADGNNQESSSEAIFAWYSVWRWSLINQNNQLKETAEYLYSKEVNSTNTYWLNRRDDNGDYNIFKDGYAHDVAGIVWGGKIDYATFFNPSPLAIHGIQYLPLTAGSLYLYEEEFIERDAEKIVDYLYGAPGNLYDKNLMYIGMLPEFNLKFDSQLANVPIDSGNSRTNLIFWMYFWRNITEIDTEVEDGIPRVIFYTKPKNSDQ